jgi:penicillin-binding protein activator
MKNIPKYSLLVLLATLISGCATTSSPTVVGNGNVQYGDAKAVETVTNEFGSTDLQMIAESMTRSLLESKAINESGKRPLITLSDVKNKTSEYIDTASITESIRTQLVRSGSVRFARSIDEMQKQTDELNRQSQSGLYDKKKSAKLGKMEGATYQLDGTITSIVKKSGSVKDVWYKFTLNMVDIESGVLEWSDEKQIRKTTKR